jgi:hypothetical protein
MSNVRIGFSPTFTAGIHFDTGVIMNTYSVHLQMITKSMNTIDHNIAMERCKYIIYEQFCDAIIIGDENKKIAKKYQDVGFRTIIFPNEAADQLTGLALYSKLQAVTEDVIDILDISLRSTMGGGISYLHHDEETAGPYEKPGWWSDAGPNCNTLPSTRKKIVTLNNPTWKSLDLDWDDGEEPETLIEIKLDKKQDKIENAGENVVEFRPNDKK